VINVRRILNIFRKNFPDVSVNHNVHLKFSPESEKLVKSKEYFEHCFDKSHETVEGIYGLDFLLRSILKRIRVD
jgi:hypothetical protein